MSFDIPGYFLDLKTKKYFKITPHGPYSLPELRKRLKREEEEERQAAALALASKRINANHISSQHRKPTHFSQFLRQRATLSAMDRMDSGMRFLLTRLKTRSSVHLHGPSSIYNNMLVAMTPHHADDYGEMFISNRCSLQHFGYQVDPQFSLWKVGQELTDNSDAQSMHVGYRLFDMNGYPCRSVIGTTGGLLWFRAFPVLPPLHREEVQHMFMQNGSIRQQGRIYECPGSYAGHCISLSLQEYAQAKDLFWSSDVDDQHDTIVVGGDKKIYQLNNTFHLKQSRKMKSSVFACHIPKSQPDHCWIGLRNGKVHMVDWRSPMTPRDKASQHDFTQSSSVYKIQTLDNVRTGHELVTLAMDGSIDVWDARQPIKKRKSKRSGPLYSLKGHVNASSRHLGFDIDTENQLLVAAGSDHCVRIWSLQRRNNAFDPMWTSEKYQAPIPAVKFMTAANTYPKLQDGWSNLVPDSLLSRKPPGIMLFGTSKESNQVRSIEWMTSVK
ncbi:uncharacterized protein ATC70_010460 [Mucor velutinosus]|uniref:Uncharacterized protein n=1 Tax=Mucor velutinosus TaxID=708070 RepID=A0AAN7HT69_9FUNG|nr:hypothetical protein ATC70_010460 [Mucor velutinosus]